MSVTPQVIKVDRRIDTPKEDLDFLLIKHPE